MDRQREIAGEIAVLIYPPTVPNTVPLPGSFHSARVPHQALFRFLASSSFPSCSFRLQEPPIVLNYRITALNRAHQTNDEAPGEETAAKQSEETATKTTDS